MLRFNCLWFSRYISLCNWSSVKYPHCVWCIKYILITSTYRIEKRGSSRNQVFRKWHHIVWWNPRVLETQLCIQLLHHLYCNCNCSFRHYQKQKLFHRNDINPNIFITRVTDFCEILHVEVLIFAGSKFCGFW